MSPVRGTALLLAFLFEIGALVAAAWALGRWSGPAAAVVGVVVMALTWGLYASPRARFPLTGPVRVAFMVVWFGAACAALAYLAGVEWGLVAGALVAANTVFLARTGGRPGSIEGPTSVAGRV